MKFRKLLLPYTYICRVASCFCLLLASPYSYKLHSPFGISSPFKTHTHIQPNPHHFQLLIPLLTPLFPTEGILQAIPLNLLPFLPPTLFIPPNTPKTPHHLSRKKKKPSSLSRRLFIQTRRIKMRTNSVDATKFSLRELFCAIVTSAERTPHPPGN